MSIYKYLQLQPVTTTDDDDDLNKFEPDEVFDLEHEEDPLAIQEKLDRELEDLKNDPLEFSDNSK